MNDALKRRALLRLGRLASALLLTAAVVAGCAGGAAPTPSAPSETSAGTGGSGAGSSSGTGSSPASAGPTPDPVTLTFFVGAGTFTNLEFETFFVQPIKEKYPHIALELIPKPQGTTIETLVTSGIVPDIVYTPNLSFHTFDKLDLFLGLDELVDKHGLELGRFKPGVIETLRNFSPDGELLALPFSLNLQILYYNKDIFDRFGVAYPADEAQTWEQLLDIGRKLTVEDNGVQYIGVDFESYATLARGLDLPIVDSATNKGAVTTPEWTHLFELLRQSYEVLGFVGPDDRFVYGRDYFLKEQSLAMRSHFLANMIGPLEELRQSGTVINWDIAPPPYVSTGEPYGRGDIHSFFVTSASPHKEEAFQVLAHILSDDVQRIVARNGRVPVIVNKELEAEFGADIEVLKDKKVENVFKYEARPLATPTIHDNEVGSFLTEAAQDIALNGVDVNTALRTAQEKIDRKLETLRLTQ